MNKYQRELLKSYRAFKTSYLENEDKVYLDFKKFKKNYSKCRFSINEMKMIRGR